jgi:hypothetical protein
MTQGRQAVGSYLQGAASDGVGFLAHGAQVGGGKRHAYPLQTRGGIGLKIGDQFFHQIAFSALR